MNKSFFITTMFFASFSPVFGMTIDSVLKVDMGINKQIFAQLSQEDRADMRLVCKEWAAKDLNWQTKPNWEFMPDVIEKEHDRYTINGRHLTSWDKTMILFGFTSMNDLASVQWIQNNTKTKNNIDMKIDNEIDFNIHAVIFAIHNKNPEVARFLIETDKEHYPDNNWKTHYRNITLPTCLQKYFDQTHPHDFSILAYFLTIWTDNSRDLKQLLCLHNTPNTDGKILLIIMSIAHNALNCFKTFLKNDQTKNIIEIHSNEVFDLAKEHDRTMIMELMETKGLYLNQLLDDGTWLQKANERANARFLHLLTTAPIQHDKIVDHHPTNDDMHDDNCPWCTIL